MEISTKVIGSKTPGARPEKRTGDVISRKGPPGHLQDTGDDPVQLSQTVEKSRQQNNCTATALKKVIEVLLPLRVDLQLVQCHPAPPAANRVTNAIPER